MTIFIYFYYNLGDVLFPECSRASESHTDLNLHRGHHRSFHNHTTDGIPSRYLRRIPCPESGENHLQTMIELCFDIFYSMI